MSPTLDDIRRALDGDPLAGTLPAGEWSLLLEIDETRVRLRFGPDATVTVHDDVDLSSTVDVAVTVSADEWAEFCAVPPPRGATTAQALVATRGGERIRGRRDVWARGAVAIDRGRS